MVLKTLTKKQFTLMYGLFFCLALFSVFRLMPSLVGFVVLMLIMFWQIEFIKIYCQKNQWKIDNLFAWIFLLAYYVVSLSLVYYFFGLNCITLAIWLAINLVLPIILIKTNYKVKLKFPEFIFKDVGKIIASLPYMLIATAFVFLFFYFLARPILNGSPTPWVDASWILFFALAIATYFLVQSIFKKEQNNTLYFLYFFIIIGVIAIKYVLSFGYDTLIHQAALKHIVEHGQIDHLTPFYIGQYSLEALIHFFTGLSFVFIERWFLPILFLLIIFFLSRYFLKSIKAPVNLVVVPISVLFLLPTQFTFTSPYALALLWAMVAAVSIYLYIANGHKTDFVLAVLATVISLFVHPFVGLSVLVAVVGAHFFQKAKTRGKRISALVITFFISSLIVVFFFALYNWLKDDVIVLAHPLYYIYNFFSLFSGPIWYVNGPSPWWLSAIYLFEKLHFIILLAIIVLFIIFNKKRRQANIYLLIIGLGALTSSWLFVSSLEVSGYSYGDQINYSYRLLQVTKWFLWPLIMLALAAFFVFVGKKKKSTQILVICGLSILLTVSWYLTYPRFDQISQPGVNNVRSIDYRAIDYIHEREGGKEGYIVLANQLFGAAAIQKYGFGPYYKTAWGKVLYYSIPMSGELNTRYAHIMDSQNFDNQVIFEIMEETGLDRVYLVTTDYWPMYELAREQASLAASRFWGIDDQIFIYYFER